MTVIGITTGDPKGIGPEVVAGALDDPEIKGLAEFQIFGPLAGDPRLPDAKAAEAALQALTAATDAALQKKIQVLVTGPVNKARMRLVDKDFTGHTEFLAQRCACEVTPFFVAHHWRVALVTSHIPLSQVAHRLNAIDILKTLRQTHQALQTRFHILEPKIAVAGLNPHAGERGSLGDEEKKVIAPAIVQARREGIEAEGPFSPDTLFWRMTQGKWDAIVAMYHDQGLIPLKTLAFKECVQITLGLPFLRLSVDHGTAEDLVGTGKADPANMKASLRLTCQLLD
ncbi:MAG: 4-hydroxythreonine-4-phosphate dehydrogenase PdxA [Deltaproteobacteria bacterium]|nr:4-hydroxythreonine-4-phosphate dehydrogenase PdxA [Deltaproteobacteria bacterium]